MRVTIAACLGLILLSAPISAGVIVTNTTSANFGPVNGGEFSIPYQVQNPNSVVVFGTYVDNVPGAVTSVGFGSGAGDQPADGLVTIDRSSLTYFLNPSTSAGLSFNGTVGVPDNSS
ncbi:MAG: hypothetical protein KDA37_10875, partial [Planctomycetales bacterium]|nr:hypothetical protein [Planctomycetales bacterium]